MCVESKPKIKNLGATNTYRKYPKKFTTSLAKISFSLFNDTVLTAQTTCRRTADDKYWWEAKKEGTTSECAYPGLKKATKRLNTCSRLLGKNSGTLLSRPVFSDSFAILKVNLYFPATFYETHDMEGEVVSVQAYPDGI
jgi:hypothetical protein